MAGIDIYKSWKSFINSKEGAAILTFITTKNSKEIGMWLKKLGAIMAEGKKGAVAKMLVGTGIKLAGVGVAAYIAYKEVRRQWDETKKIWNKDDITGFEKIARIALEAHPVTMTVRSIKSGWDWLTKTKQQREKTYSATGDSIKQMPALKTDLPLESNKSNDKYEFGSATAEYEKNKVVHKNKPLKTTSDQLSEYLGRKGGSDMSKINKTRGANTNSPDWYFRGLANKMLGTNLTWTGIKDTTNKYAFVSVCGIKCQLITPVVDRYLHPQVIANTNVEFQALRGKNTGAYSYSEEEVFLYDTVISSLIATCRYIAKVIAMANSFDVQVAKLPIHLYALVFGAANAQTTYDDVIRNKPLYITRLNSLIKELNTYAYKGRTLNSRWNYLADKCIKDYNGEKAVYGVYQIQVVPMLDSNGDLVAGRINNCTSITDMLDLVETQLGYLRTTRLDGNGCSKFIKVAGDMIKLLGANTDTFANCPYYTGQEVLKFEYDPEAFDQLKNAKIFNALSVTNYPKYDGSQRMVCMFDIKPDTSFTMLAADLAANYLEKDQIIITSDRNKEFSPMENLQMIQFQLNVERENPGDQTQANYRIKDCGTSFVHAVRVITYGPGSNPVEHDFTGFITVADTNYIKVNGYDTRFGSAAKNYSEWITWLSQIDFMPRMQLVKTTNTAIKFFDDFLDVDNYAFMTADQYVQMNNVAVYSQTFTFLPNDVNIVGLIAS